MTSQRVIARSKAADGHDRNVIDSAIATSDDWGVPEQLEVAMSTSTQFRLVVPRPAPPVPVPAAAEEQVINVVLENDDKMLLTVVEAAQRLGIGRTLMYELLSAGQIESVHLGRLHKVPVLALTRFIERGCTSIEAG